MKTLLSFACLLALTVLSTQLVNADIPKPKAPPQPPKYLMSRKLVIVPDEGVWQARLQLTESDLKELRAALDGANRGNTTVAASIAQNPTRTIVAGVLLFLAVSFAGVWLARNSSATRSRKAIAAGVMVVAVLGAAAIITRGNAGPPPGYLSWGKLSKNLSQGHATSGEMTIEVVPDDPNSQFSIKLLIPTKPKQNGDDE